uniref:Zinc finger, DHHC-type containing 7 n=1 Tax=Nothobranchius pienaari TaxID=704102 RepID=A0A1A8L361_9TELE
MDATENATKSVVAVEYVVNRWVVDYYYCLALEFLKREQYEDFRNICSTVESILNRPIEDLNNLSLKIRLLQFLSRLNEAENTEKQFEPDRTSTPLESAHVLLKQIIGDFRIPKQIGDDACISLREFIVGTFIKKKQFDKAKDALLQHLTKSVSSKRETFMNLISQKSKAHEVINQINVQCLMQEMLDFCQKVCPFTLPFMCKAARSLVEKRPEEAVITTGEQDQSTSTCSPQINIFNLQFCEHSVIQKARLEVVYNALAGGSTQMTFVQLEEEIKQETQEKEEACLQLSAEAMRSTNLSSEQEAGLQRETRSPREASPADQPPLLDTDRQTPSGSLSRYTVSRLVIGPDSQLNSQNTTHSEEPRIEIPPQTLTSKDSNDMQCPVTDAEIPFPARKRLRKSSCSSHTVTENSSDSNEESLDPDEKKSNVDDDDHRSSRSSSSDSSEVEDGPQVSLTLSRTSQKTPSKPLARSSPANDPGEVEDISIVDSSLDSSPSVSSHRSTPQRGRHKVPLDLGWKQLAKEAKESKETWSDEELHFTSTRRTAAGPGSNKSTVSNSGTRRRAWTESETEKLKEGVKKFGEGSWSKIKSFYSFDRSNVNLKDRWRTLKKANLV